MGRLSVIFAIRVVNRVDHGPEHFQLERQRLEGLALGLHGRAMPLHDREAMLHIARRLNQPALEIIERFRRYPRVMAWESLDALIVNRQPVDMSNPSTFESGSSHLRQTSSGRAAA